MGGPVEDVFRRAKETHKKVFILISDPDCGRCRQFQEMLDKQPETARILKGEYICYKADIGDTLQLPVVQIVKCPAYPFPYFFDADGRLLAFGFPNSKEYIINDLNQLTIDDYRFRELFRLPVSVRTYKELVSQTMQAYLLSKGAGSPESAYQLIKSSLQITAYPANVYLYDKLAKQTGHQEKLPVIRDYVFTGGDKIIYKNILETIRPYFAESDSSHTDGKEVLAFSQETYLLDTISRGLDYTFRFEVKNTGSQPLMINKAEHPCSCIELSWPQQLLNTGESGVIKGVFHANEPGAFNREIYVHINNEQQPMHILHLKGTVL